MKASTQTPSSAVSPPHKRSSSVVRAVRLLAILALMIGTIWSARWFARGAGAKQGERLGGSLGRPGPDLAARREGGAEPGESLAGSGAGVAGQDAAAELPHDDIARMMELTRDLIAPASKDPAAATQKSIESLLVSLSSDLRNKDSSDITDVPLPIGARRLFSQRGADGSSTGLAVYRTDASMSLVIEHFDRSMPAAGWSPASSPDAADAARWFRRYTHGPEQAMILCTANERTKGTMIVIQAMNTP